MAISPCKGIPYSTDIITLIERLKKMSLANKIWVPDRINLLKKLKRSCIDGDWMTNGVIKARREPFRQLIKLP